MAGSESGVHPPVSQPSSRRADINPVFRVLGWDSPQTLQNLGFKKKLKNGSSSSLLTKIGIKNGNCGSTRGLHNKKYIRGEGIKFFLKKNGSKFNPSF
jgi:hypothetical protein